MLTPIAGPSAEPVSLPDAKLAARINGSEFDAQLPGLIATARQMAEQETGRLLMQQTWRAELADWPSAGDVIPIYQATAVAVSYWTGNAWEVLATDAYAFGPDAKGIGTSLAPIGGWPTLGARPVGPRVRIDLTAGATEPAGVPECVRLFILAMVAWWVDNPSAGSSQALGEAPFLRRALDPARLWT